MSSNATIRSTEILADNWAKLKRVTFDLVRRDGRKSTVVREVYEYGDGAAVLPYDASRGTILLARQFRVAAELHGGNGFLLEACAGLLDGDTPEACALREAEEELGCRIRDLKRLATAYAAPGAIAERLSLFTARYSRADRISTGGGLEGEGEDIEVVEMPLARAFAAIGKDIIDMKTILLLYALMAETGDGGQASR
ncbi:MAG: NUDIX domain-containing protein [Rhizobiales bacterium]|nr:NUDIX domain-containing protein [Hyphomicrobiales bacterium]